MKRNILIIMLALLFVCSLAATTQGTARAVDHIEYGVDLAYGRRVVSTEASGGNNNVYAVDNNPDTRYASRYQDDVFWYVDLGSTEWPTQPSTKSCCRVTRHIGLPSLQ